jgi:hypothetical protein
VKLLIFTQSVRQRRLEIDSVISAKQLGRLKPGASASSSILSIGMLRSPRSDLRAVQLRHIIEPLRQLPAKRISAILNDRKVAAPRGGSWQATQVIRLLNRLDLIPV